MPLLERVRVEVYIPDLPSPQYQELLESFASEFTFAFGGCSTVRGIEGLYLSEAGQVTPDRINLIYSDARLMLSKHFDVVVAYADEVKRVAMNRLPEEEILVSVAQIYHTV